MIRRSVRFGYEAVIPQCAHYARYISRYPAIGIRFGQLPRECFGHAGSIAGFAGLLSADLEMPLEGQGEPEAGVYERHGKRIPQA